MFLMFLSFVYNYVCITYTAGKHSFLCVVTETFPHTHYLKINSRLHQFMLHKIFWKSEVREQNALWVKRASQKGKKREQMRENLSHYSNDPRLVPSYATGLNYRIQEFPAFVLLSDNYTNKWGNLEELNKLWKEIFHICTHTRTRMDL